mmetsp:Transcript_14292/g.48299  ORF Transcript_14292/g.48299 Transcript_14292/m.48299 type:complete len:176 (-) Transcript_14292:106-633(-)|eukprot:CAMPEP_0198432598 /NCGR_PEP_ID=MMETSP1452-20131203/23427_1 /TAXON_ID=1181717 /ORGANISM="Synchroma pusillum, Strain CCMP3072" /LENGTH=175 /DNA_ID=CAMNT_0044153079 /DNA_START=72 /DNA_END=599 /DNA_ORIENTATION=-
MMRPVLALLSVAVLASGLRAPSPAAGVRRSLSVGAAAEAPMELRDKLDATRTHEVKLTLNGKTETITVSETENMLEAAERAFMDPPHSCRNGVCTTCAARVTAGRDNLIMAVHGLGEEQIANNFVLSCQSHIVGPGVELELGMYDTVYEAQYGQYERVEAASQEETQKKNTWKLF